MGLASLVLVELAWSGEGDRGEKGCPGGWFALYTGLSAVFGRELVATSARRCDILLAMGTGLLAGK